MLKNHRLAHVTGTSCNLSSFNAFRFLKEDGTIDYTQPALLAVLDENRRTRQEKIPRVVKALQDAGYDITPKM